MGNLVEALGYEFLAYPEAELAALWKEEDELEAAELIQPRPLLIKDGTFFDGLDRAKWEMAEARAMPFKLLDGRYDPFNPSRMYKQISERAFSVLLHRNITTFDDACRHAIQICFHYAEEDTMPTEEELALKKQKDADYIIACRQEWKDSIQAAKLNKAEQEVLVATAREKYRKARGKG